MKILLCFLFTGCAGLHNIDRSYSIYGRDAQGNEVGAKLHFKPDYKAVKEV